MEKPSLGWYKRLLTAWGRENRGIEAVLLVGSYARGENREDSDLDVVILAENRVELLENQEFIHKFGKVARTQTECYGACTSLRVWYKNGWELEFGLVLPSWAARPLDQGTRRVLEDGYLVLVDKKGYFQSKTL